MSDLMRCALIGALIGVVLGFPAFWWAPTWVAGVLTWVPLLAGVAAAFIRQNRRLNEPPPGPPHVRLVHQIATAVQIIQGGQQPAWIAGMGIITTAQMRERLERAAERYRHAAAVAPTAQQQIHLLGKAEGVGFALTVLEQEENYHRPAEKSRRSKR